MLRRIARGLVALFGRARFRRELDEEMAFHIDCLTEDLVRDGMTPEQARRAARLRFGSPERVQYRSREERGMARIDEMVRDVRLAARGLVRWPLYAVTFIGTLALCIGASTAVFSVVDSVLWKALPYPSAESLAHAILYNPAFGKTPGNTAADGRTWERIRDEGDPLQRAVYSGWARGVNLTTEQAAAFVQQQRVGAGYFATLGIPPAMGREFEAAEDVPGGPPVAILSHDLWTTAFGADPEVLGQAIRLKGEAHTVVGIMPEGFRSPAQADVWTPLRPDPTGEGSGTNYVILVRVPDGMSMEEAQARIAAIEPPEGGQGGGSTPQERRLGLVPLDEALTAGVRLPMVILLGAVALMLLVGSANLAGLQIARTLARRPEMATRQALGSGTGALVRQAVVENVLFGLVGGALGLGLASLAMPGLEGMVQAHFGTWQEIRLDGRSVVTALGVTALATLVFGLAPVTQVARPGVYRILVSGSRGVTSGGSHLLRKGLLVGQVALVTALLFAAGMLVRSYGHLEGLDPGFDPTGVLSVQYSLEDARYGEGEAVHRLIEESLDGIRRIPGVTSAAVSLTLPYERPLNVPFRLPGEDRNRVTNVVYVTSGFFETVDIPVLRGRAFEVSDRAGEPVVAVANQAFVDATFEDGVGLGRRIDMNFAGDGGITVVGVVGNVQQAAGWGPTSQPVWETPTVYVSAAQLGGGFFRGIHIWFSPSWLVRAEVVGPELSAQVTRVFREVDPDLPVARMASLGEVMDRAFARQRFEARFLIAVALFAALLAGLGLYGLVAHEVLERRTEMGLRMALGATPGSAVWTAGSRGLRLVALGLGVGALAAVGVSRIMAHLVWGVTPWDPLLLGSLLGTLALLAGVASFVPAARVGRMDPARVLRDG